MTQRFKRLSHTFYECKYPIVFCPKCRYRILKDTIGQYVRQIGLVEEKIRKYVQWQEKQEKQAEIVQGRLFD